MIKKHKKVLLLMLFVFCCGCQKITERLFNVQCGVEEMYVGEKATITIDSEMQIKVNNLTVDILEITSKENGKLEVVGLLEGLGQIEILGEENYKTIVEINVKKRPIPTKLNIKLKENGPYYYEETYHLEYEIEPLDALRNIELNYNRNYMTINEETMEVTFHKAGEFYISCFSLDNMDLESKINFEVVYNPDVQLYRILFVGNSLTKHNYNIPELVEAMMKLDGLDVECEGSIAGGKYLIDQRNKVEGLLRNFRYTHVILQDYSNGPIVKYDQFEKIVLALNEAIKENKAKLILYQTWAYDKDIWNGITREEMTTKLVEAYDKVAEKTGATVNRAGEAFALYLEKSDNWPSLYVDMNHPSVYGAYLSTCVHYASITKNRASENPYVMEGIDESMLEIIKGIADEIVFGK